MPDIPLIGSVGAYDEKHLVVGYDLDKDGRMDLLAVYPIEAGRVLPRIIKVFWGSEDEKFKFDWYASQADPDGDGKADWVAGDLRRLRKALRKFND